jgi:hypothetical protein
MDSFNQRPSSYSTKYRASKPLNLMDFTTTQSKLLKFVATLPSPSPEHHCRPAVPDSTSRSPSPPPTYFPPAPVAAPDSTYQRPSPPQTLLLAALRRPDSAFPAPVLPRALLVRRRRAHREGVRHKLLPSWVQPPTRRFVLRCFTNVRRLIIVKTGTAPIDSNILLA